MQQRQWYENYVWREYGNHAGRDGDVDVPPLIDGCVADELVNSIVENFHARCLGDLHRSEVLGAQHLLRLLHWRGEGLRWNTNKTSRQW